MHNCDFFFLKKKQNKKLLVEDLLKMVPKEFSGNSVRHHCHNATGNEWATRRDRREWLREWHPEGHIP